jgi:antitoxin component of MazEF toxin-antitoxin module
MSTVKLTPWGNSVGIRIPAAIMKEAHLMPGAELKITTNEKGGITLTPIENAKENWTAAFNAIADAEQDELLMDLPNDFDETEWTW